VLEPSLDCLTKLLRYEDHNRLTYGSAKLLVINSLGDAAGLELFWTAKAMLKRLMKF